MGVACHHLKLLYFQNQLMSIDVNKTFDPRAERHVNWAGGRIWKRILLGTLHRNDRLFVIAGIELETTPAAEPLT